MAHIVHLHTHTDERGSLTVVDKELPFVVKRVFYVYDSSTGSTRGGHKHSESAQALTCVNGRCTVCVDNGAARERFSLDNPEVCLVLDQGDWHLISDFSKDSILLVLASEHYDSSDYR